MSTKCLLIISIMYIIYMIDYLRVSKNAYKYKPP
nr:MAG TPA: hypothetical protein [Caudoviricetes sp.]